MARVLSICIPTHGRRAQQLRGAIESVLAQVDDASRGEVEICVSDNASTDATAAMVAALAERSPLPIVYSRNDADIGLGANMMRVVELASGDFCWLLGSDDELAGDALGHVLALVGRFPEASGFCVNWANFGADMVDRGARDGAPYFAPPLTTREYRGLNEVIANVGLVWGYISTNVVARERWLAAAAAVGERALAHPTWPQLRIMGEMARSHPAWVYSPHVVVRNRTASGWMYQLGDRPRDHAKMHIDLVDGIDAVLGELIGRRTVLHRELLTRMYWMVASGSVVGQIKRVQGSAWRRELELARSCARAFWWLPAFWLDALPQLLVPGAIAQRLARRRAGPGAGSPPLPAAACRTRLEAQLPQVFASRHVLDISCTLRNDGTGELVSAGPHPVRLAYRWFELSGAPVLDGLRADLPRPLQAGAAARLTLALLTPWDEGEYELRIAPVQEFVHWFDELDPSNGLRIRATVRHPD